MQEASSEAGAEHALTELWCHVLLLHALLPAPPSAPDDVTVHQTLVQGPPPRGEVLNMLQSSLANKRHRVCFGTAQWGLMSMAVPCAHN